MRKTVQNPEGTRETESDERVCEFERVNEREMEKWEWNASHSPSLNKEPGEGGLSSFSVLSRQSEKEGIYSAGNWVRIEGMRGGA